MAFHPYPQLIPQVFNPGGFGPPRGLTRASTWPWVDHSASGLEHATHMGALFGLALATATPHGLTSPRTTNSQAHSSKGTQSPTHPQRGVRLSRLVGTRFQVLFHSPPGVLFTFPSRYLSAIGHQEVFSLTRWSWQIHGRLQGSAATREHASDRTQAFTYRTLTVYGGASQRTSTNPCLYHCPTGWQTSPHTPHNPAHATPARYHTCTV